jgi:hypothetical protein
VSGKTVKLSLAFVNPLRSSNPTEGLTFSPFISACYSTTKRNEELLVDFRRYFLIVFHLFPFEDAVLQK